MNKPAHTSPAKTYRLKLFKGLCGVSDRGVLSTPSGRSFLWLPCGLAGRLQAFLNRFADIGLMS